GLPETPREFVHRDKRPERIGDIGVDAGPTVQDGPPEGALRVEIRDVESPHDAVRREEKVKAHQETAGAGDAADLATGPIEIREIAQAVADEDGVEHRVREGKDAGVRADRVG